MKESVFLIHWNASEAKDLARSLEERGWDVRVESEDGGRASKKIIEDPPAVLAISLSRLPSHGRETALYLRSRLAAGDLPIVFFGGDPKKAIEFQTSIPDSLLVSDNVLADVLENYRKPA